MKKIVKASVSKKTEMFYGGCRRTILIFLCSFVSMMSLISEWVVAEDSANALNATVFFPASEHAKNIITLFLARMQNTYHAKSVIPVVILVALFVFYKKNGESIRKSSKSIVISNLLALTFVFAKSYETYGDNRLIFGNGFQFFASVLNVLGLTLFIWNIISFAQYKVDNKFRLNERDTEIHIAKYIIILLVAWSPFIILYFPGSVPWDTMEQLKQYLGLQTLTNHFPLLTTYLIGWGYSLGQLFGENWGIFFYLILQDVLCAVSFALVTKKLVKWHMPEYVVWISFLFYAVVPIWGAAAASTMKDYLYFPLFTIFLIVFMDIVIQEDFARGQMIEYTVCSLLLILIRSEGVYIVLFSTLSIIIAIVPNRKKVLILTLGVLLFVGDRVYLSELNNNGLVSSFDERESQSLFFQCTARYINQYEDELTEEEISIIDGIFIYEQAKENYTPGNSNPVKDTYRSSDKDKWSAYRKLWVKQFIKHPKVYIESVFSSAYGYFLPGYNYPTKEIHYLYNREFDGDLPIRYSFGDEVRSVIESYFNIWKNGPVTSLLFTPGLYTWGLIWAIWNLLRNKQYKLCVGLVPPVLVLGICCMAPVTGLFRYELPIVAVTPLIIAYSIRVKKRIE